jgi:deoxyribonuclease IV
MSYIGAHITSNPKYLLESAQWLHEKGGNLVQIFVDPSRVAQKITEYNEVKKFIKHNNMKIIVHASYTINLSKDWDQYSASIQLFISEINAAYELGAEAIVVHMGKRMELSKEDAFNNMYTGLLYVHDQTKTHPIKILLETSTGQGSEICFTIEEFAYFFKKLSKNKNKQIADRFGVCVDTCHIFAAGYDITKKSTVYMYVEAFEELIGLRHIKLIHLNDSKKELGSNVDRHENIGKGHIGKEGLLEFAKYFKKIKVPIVLETPGTYFLEDLAMLISA